jgi:hypothetical protein
VTKAELPAAIAEVEHRQEQSKILVGSGWDSNTALKEVLEAHPELNGELHRVPESAPEAESTMRSLLAKAGLHCGLWITDAGGGRYSLHEFGSCTSSEPPKPAPVAPVASESPSSEPGTAPRPQPAAVASVPVPTPVPAPTTSTQGWDQLLMQMTAPDPTAAILESLVVGFGSGHFYCNDKQAGYAHLGVQAGGVVLAAIGGALVANGTSAGAPVELVGATAIAVSRVVEVATVPYAARKEAKRMVANRKK